MLRMSYYNEETLKKLRAVKLREWLPKIAIISLKAMPYDQRRLKLRHLRAIIAGLV
jgi:hypothetical protein